MPRTVSLLFIILFFFISCSDEKFPSINIIVDEPIGWDKKQSCSVIYSYKTTSKTLEAEVKCRGGMSSRYFKHSYALELKEKNNLLGINHDDDWILNANYIDKTFMRHKISYDLYRQMNTKNIAAKSSYINVYINNNYNGLYVLMEEVNGKMVGLDKKDSLSMLFKDPPIFFREKLSSVQDSLNYYLQKFPKIKTKDHTEYLEKFIDFIFNSSDSVFAENISYWIDIDNVIDWHILLLFTNNSDGIMKNFLLYKLNSNTPFRIAIWDYDHSFGRDGDNELNMMRTELDCNRSILLKRLNEIESTNYNFKLKERWHYLRKKNIISTENFNEHISTNHQIIQQEIDKNFDKWPINDKWYFDDNNYIEELDLMREFVKIRIDKLDNYFAYQPSGQ